MAEKRMSKAFCSTLRLATRKMRPEKKNSFHPWRNPLFNSRPFFMDRPEILRTCFFISSTRQPPLLVCVRISELRQLKKMIEHLSAPFFSSPARDNRKNCNRSDVFCRLHNKKRGLSNINQLFTSPRGHESFRQPFFATSTAEVAVTAGFVPRERRHLSSVRLIKFYGNAVRMRPIKMTKKKNGSLFVIFPQLAPFASETIQFARSRRHSSDGDNEAGESFCAAF